MESDHTHSASDVADSYDDDDLSASVSEDNDGNDDASESQPDVVSAEEDEGRAVKEGGETSGSEDGCTDVGEEHAELKHLCQSKSPSAVQEVAATKIESVWRGHDVRKVQLVRGLCMCLCVGLWVWVTGASCL